MFAVRQRHVMSLADGPGFRYRNPNRVKNFSYLVSTYRTRPVYFILRMMELVSGINERRMRTA